MLTGVLATILGLVGEVDDLKELLDALAKNPLVGLLAMVLTLVIRLEIDRRARRAALRKAEKQPPKGGAVA